MKDVGLRIRIQRDLRDKFMDSCRDKDVPAAQVLREFMRACVSHHEAKPNNVQASRAKVSELKDNRRRSRGQ